jgi:hypothetical protein
MYRRPIFLFWGLFLAVFMLGCVAGGGGRIDSVEPRDLVNQTGECISK